LVRFAVRRPQLKRLERGTLQPFANRFHVHIPKCTR
jgi:hypothetical protein